MKTNSGETRGSQFVTTQWTLISQAAQSQHPQAAEALNTLCRTYWQPLYLFLRRCGSSPGEAEDLTQGFLADLLERRSLRQASPKRGRFRSFLLASLKNFATNERRRVCRKKRGGDQVHISIEAHEADNLLMEATHSHSQALASPDVSFERAWCVNLLHRALSQLEAEYAARGRSQQFHALKDRLWGEIHTTYTDLAVELNLTEKQLRTAMFRFRKRLQDIVRAAVADTVVNPGDNAEVEEELSYLLRTLGGGGHV